MQYTENKEKALDKIRSKYQSKNNTINTIRAPILTACTTPRKLSPFRYDTTLKNASKSIEKIKVKQIISLKEQFPLQKKGLICKNIKKNMGSTSQQKIKYLSKKYEHTQEKYFSKQNPEFYQQSIFTKTTPRTINLKSDQKYEETINKTKNYPFFNTQNNSRQILMQISNTEPTYPKIPLPKQRNLKIKLDEGKNIQPYDDCMRCIQDMQKVSSKIRGVLKQN